MVPIQLGPKIYEGHKDYLKGRHAGICFKITLGEVPGSGRVIGIVEI